MCNKNVNYLNHHHWLKLSISMNNWKSKRSIVRNYSICKFTFEFEVGVEKVVPEILGRGGMVSDAIRSLATSCISELSQGNGRSRSEGEGNADLISKREWAGGYLKRALDSAFFLAPSLSSLCYPSLYLSFSRAFLIPAGYTWVFPEQWRSSRCRL